MAEAMTGASGAGLPPFDPAATCPKCGYDEIGTSLHDPHQPGCRCEGADRCREHLGRFCRRCHWQWAERVIGKERTCGHVK